MPRRVLISAAVVFVAGALIFLVPFLTAKREVTALTPAVPPLPPGSLVPATLGAGHELCIRNLPMSPDGQVARIITATGGRPGGAMLVRASGPGYSATTAVPAGWAEGPLEIPIRPPRTSLRGSLCFRNAGRADFSIMASGVGQKLAAPQPYLDQQPLQQDVPLVFHRAKPASLLSRTGALIDHASVFTPIPKPLIWVLLVATLLGVAIAPLLALRRAAAVDAAAVPPASATSGSAPPVPGAALARRIRADRRIAWARGGIRRIPAIAWLVALAVVAAIYIYVWGIRVTTYTPDETLYVAIANWLPHHLPGGLFQLDFYQRGTQRLNIFVLALGLKLLGSPNGFKFTHLVNALAFGSAAIPAYLMARGLEVRRSLALLAGFLVVAVPWTVLMTSVLTEPLAYPCFAWAVWASWRAIADPTPRRELLAIALIVLALLARSIFLIMLALLPAGVFLQELRFGRLQPRRLWERHPVVVAFVGLGILAGIASVTGLFVPVAKLTGQYGTKFSVPINALLSQDAFFSSRAVVGLGFVPFALGLAYIVANALRPRDARAFAFATVALLSVLLLFYATKPIPNVPTYVDERYMLYIGPLLAVGCAAALDRRDLRAWAVVVAGMFGGWLVWREHWNTAGDPTEFFTAPAEVFYARVGLLRLQQYVPSWLSLRDAALILFAFASAVSAYAVSRRPGARIVRPLLVAALVLVQIAQAQYAIAKHVNGAGGRYWSTLSQRAWVDDYLRGKPGDAGLLETGVGERADYDYVWRFIQFFNTRVTSEWGINGLGGLTITLGDTRGALAFNSDTGAIKPTPSMPAYFVVARDFLPVRPAGELVSRPSFTGQDLLKATGSQMAFWANGFGETDGSLAETSSNAFVRFYAKGTLPSQRCAQIPIQAPPGAPAPTAKVRYLVGSQHGELAAGAQVILDVPLEFHGRPYIDVPVRARGKFTSPDGKVYALRVLEITTGPCTGG